MKKTLFKIFLCIFIGQILFNTSTVFAGSIPKPSKLSIHVIPEKDFVYRGFEISWKNDAIIQKAFKEGKKIYYLIDFKKDNKNWLSEDKNPLLKIPMDKNTIEGMSLGLSKEQLASIGQIDIFTHSYSFRLSYLVENQTGPFSNSVRVGIIPSYSNASQWSEEELILAQENGFIPPNSKKNMKELVTREEFADIMVRVYEKIKRIHLVTGPSPFSDSQNPSVIKAEKLGLVNGVGYGKFAPNENISREEMASILNRFLEIMGLPMDTTSPKIFFTDHGLISPWAHDSVYKIQAYGLIEGDANKNFMPKDKASREQGVILGQRIYDILNK